MGVVYLATEEDGGREVAVKTIGTPSLYNFESLRREIHVLSRLRHPGIARVLAQGVDEGVPWVAMEKVSGVTLDELFREVAAEAPTLTGDETEDDEVTDNSGAAGAFSLARTLRIVALLCDTLGFLHGEGIVHRDLKPQNIVVRPDDTPVLIDFGLTAVFAHAEGREIIEAAGLTEGTAGYVAPEQIRGEDVDARADLYALGCMLFEIATGRLPFVGSVSEVLRRHLDSPPPRPSSLSLGVPPALETLVLRLLEKDPSRRPGYASDVRRVLDELAPGGAPAPERSGADYLYRPSLSGRSEASALLDEALARVATKGRGERVDLWGESGIGKTRLAREVTRAAVRRGFSVVVAECPSRRGKGRVGDVPSAPLHALRPLLRTIVDRCRAGGAEETRALVGDRAAILAPYEPALLDLPHGSRAAPLPPLPAEAARDRLFGALAETLTALAKESPVLFVIDDRQWADELTRAFFASLDDAFFERTPVLLLGLVRSEEASADDRALRAKGTTTIDLPRLDAASVRAMVADMMGIGAPNEAFVRSLTLESEGNPFFVSEYLRAAVAERRLARNLEGRWRLPASAAGEAAASGSLPLPRSVLDLVKSRLARLSAESLLLLEAASVGGSAVDLAIAKAALGEALSDGLMATQELLNQRLLEQTEDAGFRFSHDKLREVAYAGIAPARLAGLHRAYATCLEEQGQGLADFPDCFKALAHHFELAGDAPKGLFYLGKAAEHALSRGAHAEAKALFEAALAKDDAAPGPSLRRARWLRLLGEAEFGTGAVGASRLRASEALGALGRPVPKTGPGWALRIGVELSRQAAHRALPEPWFRAKIDERERSLEAALSAGQLASAYYFEGSAAPLLATLLLGVNLAERASSATSATQSYARLGYVAGIARLPQVARAYFARAGDLSREAEDPASLALRLYLEAFYCLGLGRFERCEEAGDEAARILRKIGDKQDAEIAETIVAHSLHYTGRLTEASDRYASIEASARARQNAQHIGWGLFLGARALLEMGRLEEARASLREARSYANDPSDKLSIVICDGLLAQTELRLGETDEATHLAEGLLARLTGAPLPLAPCLHGYDGAFEVFATRAKTDPKPNPMQEKATKVAAALTRFALLFPLATPAALRAKGTLAALRGESWRAQWLLKKSLRSAQTRGMPGEERATQERLKRL